jgi:kumamolisin
LEFLLCTLFILATFLPVTGTKENKIENILGLNTSKISNCYFKVPEKSRDVSPQTTTTFTPLQLATLYNFPTGLDGTGQKIGIIELGGGYTISDLKMYFTKLGITGTPNVTAVSVDGAVNNPGDTSGDSVEVILDIEIVMAIVPKANIRVYFAPNTDKGFYDAINKAITDNCGVISISWGERNKIGLTMRQPYLGSLTWIEEEKKKAKKNSLRKRLRKTA